MLLKCPKGREPWKEAKARFSGPVGSSSWSGLWTQSHKVSILWQITAVSQRKKIIEWRMCRSKG